MAAISQAIPVDSNTPANLNSAPGGIPHLVLAPSTPLPPESLKLNESTFMCISVDASTAATVAAKLGSISIGTKGNMFLDDARGHVAGDAAGEGLTIIVAILLGLL